MPNSTKPVIYWDYLRLRELLHLQSGVNAEGKEVTVDESHFIIVHQVFELWFKQMIVELDFCVEKLDKDIIKEEEIPIIVHHLVRVAKILSIAAEHFEIMELLRPHEFLEFRDKLGNASGFQSFQLRELEVRLGITESTRSEMGHSSPIDYILQTCSKSENGKYVQNRLQKALNKKSLKQQVYSWLMRTPIQIGEKDNQYERAMSFLRDYVKEIAIKKDLELKKINEGNGELTERQRKLQSLVEDQFQSAESFLLESESEKESILKAAILFIESYHSLPLLSWPKHLIDVLVDIDENLAKFRYYHARMVERIIGNRVGTGGSSGVQYLDETTKYRIFPEIWAVRTILLPEENLPKLQNESKYGFEE